MQKQRIAIVYGMLPLTDDINQFSALDDKYEISLVSTEVICNFVKQNTFYTNLNYVVLSDYKDNPTYIAGLEKALSGFDIVILKERYGLYAYQVLKAKWQHHFKLIVWCDNLYSFQNNSKDELSIIRSELVVGADLFITQTKQGVEALISEGVDKSKIEYLSPWIADIKDNNLTEDEKKKVASTVRASLGYSDSNFIITHIGQREWEEGLEDFLIGVDKLIKKDSYMKRELQIIFCGIGSYTSNISNLCIHLNLEDRVKFLNPSKESVKQLSYISDALFFNFIPYQEKKEGDPQRILFAMNEGIPIISSRSVIIEETCGKHRIDFCLGSYTGISDSIQKVYKAKSLVKDIVSKNKKKVEECFSNQRFKKSLITIIEHLSSVKPGSMNLEHQILEAESLVQSKQYLKAINLIESIFKTEDLASHHKSNLYRLIGDSFIKLNDTQGAIEAYKESLVWDKYFYKAYVGLGTVCLIQEKFEIAILHFQKAVALMPNDEMTNLGLALAFQGLKESREALKWIIKSLEINPFNKEAIYSLVKLSLEIEEYKDCEKILEYYIEKHPLDRNIIYTLASIYFKDSKLDLAERYVNRILDKDPTDEGAYALKKKIQYHSDIKVANK